MQRMRKIGLVIAIIIVVAGVLFAAFYFGQPAKQAETKLAELAKDYYETYYYDLIAEQNDNVVAALEKFSVGGLPEVKLRQLLHFDNDRHLADKAFFQNQDFFCDTNTTSVRYFPVAPYGKTDYTVEYTYGCEAV